jgi:very-short-patch-repair endonuclease
MSTERARELRKNATDAEQRLWRRLRDRQLLGLKFRRQHRIGRFIADFYCDECRLVIELDGGQHADRITADERRTAYLEGRAIAVLRFWNNDVLTNTDGVLERIVEVATARRRNETPSPGRSR